MKYLFNSLDPFVIGDVRLFAEIRTDGETLYVKLSKVQASSPSVYGFVRYNGTTESFYVGTSDTLVTFRYSPGVKTATVYDADYQYECQWCGSLADPAPAVSIAYTGVRSNDDIVTAFTYTGGGSYNALVAPKMYYSADGGISWTLINYTAAKTTASIYAKHIPGGNLPGTLYRYVLLFASYAHGGDAIEDYVGLAEYELPVFTLTAAGTPFAPCGLSYEPSHADQPIGISWNAVNDPDFSIDSYVVERTTDSFHWTEVYRGSDPYCLDTPPAGSERVTYSVCSLSDGISSAFAYGEEIELLSSNLYVGCGGEIRQAAGVYIGDGGEVREASAAAIVGA